MTFYSHLVLKMLWMLQLLVQELHTKTSQAMTFQCGFTGASAERRQVTSLDILPFFLYLNACVELGVVQCFNWAFGTN